MVNLSDVRTSNATIAERHGLVYIFTGGTSGIGEATLRALAAYATDSTFFIIGRNAQRAAEIIDDCRKLSPNGTFEFLKADLTLVKNVDELCTEIRGRVEKVDVLFMTQNYFTIQGRDDTTEGIDAVMCLRYYSRMRLAYNLTPLLLQAQKPRVVSIFAAGQETRLYPDDLSLRSHYGLFNVISHGAFMTTFFFEELVAQNSKLSCLHVYPGLVKTQEFQKALFPAWLKWGFRWILLPLLTPWCVPVEECGERSLFCAGDGRYKAPEEAGTEGTGSEDAVIGVDGQRGSGVYAVNWNGEVFRKSEAIYDKWRKKDMRKLAWEHTIEAFKAVEEGRRFAG